MGLETGTTIANLDESWPLRGGDVNQGDDHLRLIKTVLKATFPGENNQGFDQPILATESELNRLSGLRSNVQDQLDAITGQDTSAFPAGTRMLFYQPSAPAGWVQFTGFTDGTLTMLVTSAGGTTAGTDDPTIMNKVPSHTHGFTTSSDGSHTHVLDFTGELFFTVTGSGEELQGVQSGSRNTLSAGVHNHTGTTNANSGADTWAPRYARTIICTKS